MSSTWPLEILQSLRERDDTEKKDVKYFKAFTQLAQQLENQKQSFDKTTTIGSLPHSSANYPPSSSTSSSSSSSSGNAAITSNTPSPSLVVPSSSAVKSKKQQVDDIDIRLVKAMSQNQQLANENSDLIDNLNSVTLKNEQLELTINDRDGKIRRLEKGVLKLKQKIENLEMEIKEKNKTIELVNDELLTSQLQNNVLRNQQGK